MSILSKLRRARLIFADCPECQESFRLSEGRLFDATARLPDYAQAYLTDERTELAALLTDLRNRTRQARVRPKATAEAVTIGTTIEKIAPSLPGFPLHIRDCRPLFQPIDYIVFNGISVEGKVDSVTFVEVKSGNARLTNLESQIRTTVEDGKARLLIADTVTPRLL